MRVAGYVRAQTVAEAVSALADGGILVAGGTDLMVKARAREPYAKRVLVDVSEVPELRCVAVREDGATEIGASVTLAELSGSAGSADEVAGDVGAAVPPLLAEAAAHVGGVQTRNRATIGGNVANACPAADCIPALMALGARAVVAGLGEAPGTVAERELAMGELFRDCPACLRHEGMLVRTCLFADPTAKKLGLGPGEMLARLVVPARPVGERAVFRKLTTNASVDLATMNLACVATLADDGRVEALSVSMGGLFSAPRVMDEVTSALVGELPAPGLVAEACLAAADELARRSAKLADLGYKRRALPGFLAGGLCDLLGTDRAATLTALDEEGERS